MSRVFQRLAALLFRRKLELAVGLILLGLVSALCVAVRHVQMAAARTSDL